MFLHIYEKQFLFFKDTFYERGENFSFGGSQTKQQQGHEQKKNSNWWQGVGQNDGTVRVAHTLYRILYHKALFLLLHSRGGGGGNQGKT